MTTRPGVLRAKRTVRFLSVGVVFRADELARTVDTLVLEIALV
jgi:hypothetical protein